MASRPLTITILSVLLAGCIAGDAAPSDPDIEDDALVPRAANPLATPILAAKWWNPLVPAVNDEASSAGLELPHGLSYPEAVKKLCNQGIDTVFIRIGEPKIMTYDDPSAPCAGLSDDACRAKINGRIADALEAVKNSTTCKLHIYLMQRQWLTTDDKIDHFVNIELHDLLATLDARRVKSVVRGLALVEGHLANACEVKNEAVAIATQINQANNDWLKTKTLFIGGAGLGAKFKDIDTPQNCSRGLRATLIDLAAQTRAFSFIYKHFDGALAGVCADWNTIRGPAISVADAKAYLLDGCPGLRDLIHGIDARRVELPAYANVTFWGDGGDGITNIQPNVLTALHQIFVEDRDAPNFKHAVFDRLLTGKPMTVQDACPLDEDDCKHLIEIDGTRDASLNHSAYDTWRAWN